MLNLTLERQAATRTIAREALRTAILDLQRAKIASASLDARILLENALGVTREQLLFSLDLEMSSEQYTRFSDAVEKRRNRRPIAQITGKREFWGLNFSVTCDTLDPRPDSETLIESVLEKVKNRGGEIKILDLGTGTGCLLLSLLSEFPAAKGVGVDRSQAALAVAKENALALGMSGRVEFRSGNWCKGVDEKFDIVISNPPYIPSAVIPTLEPEVAKFEPLSALDGGEKGLDCYREIIKNLTKVMEKDAIAVFELGIGQQREVEAFAGEYGFETVGVKNDLGGIARSIVFKKNCEINF